MQFAKTILSLLPVSLALGSPTPRSPGSEEQWTLESLKRACNEDDTQCDWSFRINIGTGADATDCVHSVQGSPASHANNGVSSQCGAFTITSGYNELGNEPPFTVLSVDDSARNLIIWAGYKETQLVNDQVVSPDQSYTPANLPW